MDPGSWTKITAVPKVWIVWILKCVCRALLVDAHAGTLKAADRLGHEGVHAQQVGHVEQAGADGFPVWPEAHVEESPGREIAPSQRTQRWTVRHVVVFGGADDLAVWVDFRELRHGLCNERGEILRRNVGSM